MTVTSKVSLRGCYEYSAPGVLNYSKIYIGCQDAQVVRRSFLVVMAKEFKYEQRSGTSNSAILRIRIHITTRRTVYCRTYYWYWY